MTRAERIAWVQPPEPIRGQDHLGVQAPCVALYAQLLPGITNVTDRARYYTFHPWVLWSFERLYKTDSLDEFRRVLRRAECLFALIAIRHARALSDSDEGRHGKAMIGRDKLLRIDEASDFSLDEYAALEGPDRYFQNKLGALGQYYFGPLRDPAFSIARQRGSGIRRAMIENAARPWPRRSRAVCPRTRSSVSSNSRPPHGLSSTSSRRSAPAGYRRASPSTSNYSICSWHVLTCSCETGGRIAEHRSA